MCVQLLSAALSGAGSIYAATASPGATADETRETAGNLAATASAVDALSALASAQVRSRAMRAEGAMEARAGRQRAERIRRAGDAAAAESRAAVGASGVRLTSDSVMEAERSLQRAIETDAGVAIVTGMNRQRSANVAAEFTRAAGTQSVLESAADGFGAWKRSRAPRNPLGVTPYGRDRQYNPAGDGFTSDPMAGP